MFGMIKAKLSCFYGDFFLKIWRSTLNLPETYLDFREFFAVSLTGLSKSSIHRFGEFPSN
ncbi:MAG: hypothetical protein D6680_10460 [Cyanobacteria bacterium J007]|nr:MAG: hypothetical protein D6680_10460 [Cyanobacteria bacterium J007]